MPNCAKSGLVELTVIFAIILLKLKLCGCVLELG
jgi:hypothetical protein